MNLTKLSDAIPGHTCGKRAHFVFSLVVIILTALAVHPHLAESVTELVRTEHIDTALEQRHEREEILWFARAIYSESSFTEEQYYIAWAIRNRVESPYYPDTYEEVVLQPHQFSGLNEYDAWYEVNISRDYGIGDHVWESALQVAHEVYAAPNAERLLSEDTMHFYSPVAVSAPKWAVGHTPVETLHGKRGVRFAFYAGVK